MWKKNHCSEILEISQCTHSFRPEDIYLAHFQQKSNGHPNKISPSLERCIKQEVKRDSSLSSNQIVMNTDAECSSWTIQQHLNKKGFKNMKQLNRPWLLPCYKTSCLQFTSDYQTWSVDKKKKVSFSGEKKFNLDGLLLACKRCPKKIWSGFIFNGTQVTRGKTLSNSCKLHWHVKKGNINSWRSLSMWKKLDFPAEQCCNSQHL